MTTSNSPIARLRAQATEIAKTIKQLAANGGNGKPSFKAGIIMDDKFISIEMQWVDVPNYDMEKLINHIVTQMQMPVNVAPN